MAWRLVWTTDFRLTAITRIPQREVYLRCGLVFAEKQHAGGVDQVVQTAVAGEGFFHGPAHRRIVDEIALHVGSPRLPVIEALGPRLQVESGDRAAFVQELAGGREAHAAARPGHEGVLSREPHRSPTQ